MFGDSHAGRRNDQRGNRRDVERVRAIASCSARVEHVFWNARELRRARAHRPREADDLGGPFAFHGEGNQQAGDLRRLRAPFHDFVHGCRRLVGGEVLAPLKLLDERGEHHNSRKLRSSFRPSGVNTDSGWNCTP